jgi:hypothetical protein
MCPLPLHVGQRSSLRTTEDLRNPRPYAGFATIATWKCIVSRERSLSGSVHLETLGGHLEVAVDKHTMLLIGSAIVAILFIAYMMFGPGGTLVLW